MMKVSVIVPIYGVEKYIERCARSILAQTYSDIEFVFVNDCTKDYSMDILLKVLQDYPNREILIINKDKNEGLPQARKTGLYAAHGDYIIHFDSDDWVDSDCIFKMVNAAKSNNADIVIADYYENSLTKETCIQVQHYDNTSNAIDKMLRAKMHSGVWNKLIKRDLYNNVIFPVENMHEDLVIMVQLFSNAKKIFYVNEPFYHYNIANSQSITQKRAKLYSQALSAYSNLRIIESYFSNQGIMWQHKRAFSNFVNTFKCWMVLHKETRNLEWMHSLYEDSNKYIFKECRAPIIRKSILYIVSKNVLWPLKIIDIFDLIYKKISHDITVSEIG